MIRTLICLLLCMILGYLVGTLNLAYLIAKLRGFDIREKGSGNAGATNAIITMGRTIGFAIAVVDILKAYFAIRLAQYLFPGFRFAAEITGIFTILGHIFPFTMNFRGGKGLACLGGVILAFNARVFWIMLLCEILFALLVDYIFVVPLSASVVFPIVYRVMVGSTLGALLYASLIPLFFYKHQDNIARFRAGTEAKFSYLWRTDEEVQRLTREVRGK